MVWFICSWVCSGLLLFCLLLLSLVQELLSKKLFTFPDCGLCTCIFCEVSSNFCFFFGGDASFLSSVDGSSSPDCDISMSLSVSSLSSLPMRFMIWFNFCFLFVLEVRSDVVDLGVVDGVSDWNDAFTSFTFIKSILFERAIFVGFAGPRLLWF